MNRQQLFIYILLSIVFIACSKDDSEDIPENFEGYNYLPLSVGSELIYRVDSVSYDDFTGEIDTVVYYIRELVESKGQDLGGRTEFNVGLYQRMNDSLSWRKLRVNRKHRGTYRYELTINSISFLPLVFPPLQDSRWNVNSLNTLEEVIYRYEGLHQAFKYSGRTYDSTITVLQKDQLSLIGREYEREVYAAGLGLVFKESIDLETDISSGDVTSGFIRRQYLIE